MPVLISIFILFVFITLAVMLNTRLFKRKNYDLPNELRSLRALGLITSLNIWPVIIGIDSWGIYVIKTKWHGFIQIKQYFPHETIVLLRMNEYFGLFGKVEMLLRLNSVQNEYIKIPQYYTLKKCRIFYKHWLISKKVMYNI